MTKSFLINTSVAAIVSAFVFTAGVSSASARGDNDQYGHESQSDGYKGSYGGHYRKHYAAYAYSPKEYRRYNGMVCAPGTLTKMDDGKMYRCQ